MEGRTMTELNQRACDQLMPEYWQYWKGMCLSSCNKVSQCSKFSEGANLDAFKKKQAHDATHRVGRPMPNPD